MAKTARSQSEPIPATPKAVEPAESRRPTEEDIAVRAYKIYQERGDAEGNATDDWLQAERELTEGL